MKIKLTPEILFGEYTLNQKSVPQISKETGHCWTVIYRLLKKYDIKTRPGKTGKDYTGQHFGEWLVKAKHPTRRATWICACSCGVEKPVKSSNLLSGGSTKCSNCTKTGCGAISGTMWSNIRNGAIQRDLDFSITVEEAWKLYLQQNGKCALTNLEINFKPRGKSRSNTTASLDRIDSTKGYIIGNIQWVYKKINMMKQGYPQKEFIELCRLVAKCATIS